MEKLKKALLHIPKDSGVYLMYNETGDILYIGKAKNLSSRVRSYFSASNLSANMKTAALMAKVDNIEWIVTENEVEAFLLEENLIKKHKPKYNIDLKDDKRYPFICITTEQEWPRVFITRKKLSRQSLYFGPFVNANEIRWLLEYLQKTFKIRICNKKFTKIDARGCLMHHINKCVAPCTGNVSKEDYKKRIDAIIAIFKGDYHNLIANLTADMEKFSSKLEFEKAADVKMRIEAVKTLLTKQLISDISSNMNADFIAFSLQNGIAAFVLLRIRNSLLINRIHKMMEYVFENDAQTLLAKFIFQFYESQSDLPDKIYSKTNGSTSFLQDIYKNVTGKKVVFITQKPMGTEKKMLENAQYNAQLLLNQQLVLSQNLIDKNSGYEVVEESLKHNLLFSSEEQLITIEGFDIAHIQGVHTTASCVRFKSGLPDKKGYMKFKIKQTGVISDVDSMKEVLERRLEHIKEKPLPDLFLIDGGIAQLNAAVYVLNKKGINIKICSLAKREELIFIPSKKGEAIKLPERDEGLKLLQKVRNEAHRFCTTYHKKLRGDNMLKSVLSDVNGVGEKSIKKLFQHFSSLDEISKLSPRAISEKTGISVKTCEKIKIFLSQN